MTTQLTRKAPDRVEETGLILAEAIKRIQAKCPHPRLVQTRVHDDTYTYSFPMPRAGGEEVLERKNCPDCGLDEHRPKGLPWEICYKCWAPMERDAVIPGQGGRLTIHECTGCGHRVAFT